MTTITSTTTRTTTLTDLVAELDRAVRGHRSDAETAEAVGAALTPYLGADGLLSPEQLQGDPAGYRQHLLHVADDGAFSLVALVWLPGQTTPIHDHLSWCVVGVHQGAEREVRYRVERGHLVRTEELVNAQGEVSIALPPGDIHLVCNVGDDVAVSLHVYGADLRVSGTSIRRRYDLPLRP